MSANQGGVSHADMSWQGGGGGGQKIQFFADIICERSLNRGHCLNRKLNLDRWDSWENNGSSPCTLYMYIIHVYYIKLYYTTFRNISLLIDKQWSLLNENNIKYTNVGLPVEIGVGLLYKISRIHMAQKLKNCIACPYMVAISHHNDMFSLV